MLPENGSGAKGLGVPKREVFGIDDKRISCDKASFNIVSCTECSAFSFSDSACAKSRKCEFMGT